MRFLKHILSIFLLQLVLFTAHGRVNEISRLGYDLSVRQKDGKHHQGQDIVIVKSTRDLLTAGQHSTGGSGHTCSRQSIPDYLPVFVPQWLHTCTKSFISSIFTRLLEYYTLHQLVALFPKHWFW